MGSLVNPEEDLLKGLYSLRIWSPLDLSDSRGSYGFQPIKGGSGGSGGSDGEPRVTLGGGGVCGTESPWTPPQCRPTPLSTPRATTETPPTRTRL